jgi:hypothetical protein
MPRIYAAFAKTSSMPSMIFAWSRRTNDNGSIRSAHSVRRRAARASRNDGVAFFGYHRRAVHVGWVANVTMYQVHVAQ